MEKNGDFSGGDNKSLPDVQINGENPVLTSNLFLDLVGEVVLTINSDGLSWNLVESICKEQDESPCLGIKLASKSETAIKFSDVYAVEFIDWGLVHESILGNARGCLLGHASEMYRFTVHGVHRSKNQPSLWAPCVYTFGHKDMDTCQLCFNRITASLNLVTGRPKSLLVFVHPKSGKGNGCRTWEAVAPIFSRAKIKTKVMVTQRAGQAFDVMSSITNEDLNVYDGVIAVGGDGLFNEILNGLLSSKLKASYPPTPTDFLHSGEKDGCIMLHESNKTVAEASGHIEDTSPLLPGANLDDSRSPKFRTEEGCCNTADQGPSFSLPNEWFRFGVIPAGSTDAVVIWYGFYGDVIRESEKYRWMGPKRYDYAGTMVFLRHRSYEAEIAYLEVKSEESSSASEEVLRGSRKRALWGLPKKSERKPCRVNCNVCTSTSHPMPAHNAEGSRWLKSKGRFLSIGAAVISCRNERAPDGLVADAHLSDGFLHLILIKDCPHALYLWHLTQLAKKGGDPLNFAFVEHHKTTAFTFTSSGEESVWNVDGELFQAHKLSAQVFRGLVSLFATGPEV
ncbi:hypothetical protein RHGRI_008291 [Rhododendron griersonianum]|uniref:DAGKc domain-containing protein n=1 Tax=Rhododendron griersonianum TaxID=479676 RepID=A0AAV6KZT8_9ERIC|nr:hypothetical protein RHGRI_008291 [Rhododendron griersonianum]